MNLIDKDALRLMNVEECKGHTIEYALGWKACIEWIKTLSAVEAEPARTGKWIKDCLYFTNGGTYRVFRCSECHWQMPLLSETKYCGNCGAKMGGERRESE